MAARKTTTKEKTSNQTSKKDKKIQITYNPKFSASQKKSINLMKVSLYNHDFSNYTFLAFGRRSQDEIDTGGDTLAPIVAAVPRELTAQ